YLSTNALGKALARELSESFGGSVSSSPKLFGQKQGREVYRVTSLVRLGPFHIGGVVRYKESLAEVTAVRPLVVLSVLSHGGRGSRGRLHHAAARGGGERQDELLLAARPERRPRGSQGDLHRHGGRVPRPPPADVRRRFRRRGEEHPVLGAIQFRGTRKADRG